jgi:hypothetical protein
VLAASCGASFLAIAAASLVLDVSGGSWLVVAAIPIAVVMALIRRHYSAVRAFSHVSEDQATALVSEARRPLIVVVLVGTVDIAAVRALQFARRLDAELLFCVSVVADSVEQDHLLSDWDRCQITVPLHTISSPYREISRPVLEYLDEIEADIEDSQIVVVIPQTIFRSVWSLPLHRHTATRLKLALQQRPRTIPVTVPAQFEHERV